MRWRQRAEDFSHDWASSVQVHTRPLGYACQERWLLAALAANHTEGSGVQPRAAPNRKEHCPDWTDVVGRLERRELVTLAGGLQLTTAGLRHVEELQDRYPDGPPVERSQPMAHVAPIATGSRVIEDEDLFPMLHRHVRKTLAIDMESSAVAAVAALEGVEHCLIAKGVQDYADQDKDDRFRSYAIETSYRFVAAFLRHTLESTSPSTRSEGSQVRINISGSTVGGDIIVGNKVGK